MHIAYWGMNCYSEEGFGLIVERLGQDHLPTVWEINPEVLSIRLPNKHRQTQKHINKNTVIISFVLTTWIRTHWCLVNGVNDGVVVCIDSMDGKDDRVHWSHLKNINKQTTLVTLITCNLWMQAHICLHESDTSLRIREWTVSCANTGKLSFSFIISTMILYTVCKNSKKVTEV